MMKCYAITIARGLGTDGGEIARRLSQKLNIRFVDKELLQMASDESGINEALFAMTDEKLNRKIMKRSVGAYRGEVYEPGSEDYLTNKNMFEYQGKVLMKMIISDESFVVVGRAANYIFKKNPNVLSVNIWASDHYCIENIMNRNALNWDEAEKLIKKTNKYRTEYYNYYTGEDWKDPKNYDVCLNSGTLGIDHCVDIISNILKTKLAGKAAL
jgi:cytidylate kinase